MSTPLAAHHRFKLRPPLLRLPRPAQHWSIDELQAHLQTAVDVELWTIPFYLAAWYSIEDRASEAAELLRSVLNQEMLHMQLAANVANAFGAAVVVKPPLYDGSGPPCVSPPDEAIAQFPNPSFAIGPFDTARLHAMCLIEYPDVGRPDFNPELDSYDSIGELYAAILVGARQHAAAVVGGRNQVDVLRHFYPKLAIQTVTASGGDNPDKKPTETGIGQVAALIRTIVTQGEGVRHNLFGPGLDPTSPAELVGVNSRNLADDPRPAATHFQKFAYLNTAPLPKRLVAQAGAVTRGHEAQARLVERFAKLCDELQKMFRGDPVAANRFGPLMFEIGGLIRLCWSCGVTPTFT